MSKKWSFFDLAHPSAKSEFFATELCGKVDELVDISHVLVFCMFFSRFKTDSGGGEKN